MAININIEDSVNCNISVTNIYNYSEQNNNIKQPTNQLTSKLTENINNNELTQLINKSSFSTQLNIKNKNNINFPILVNTYEINNSDINNNKKSYIKLP